jgi:hypothetical protein
MDKYIKFSVVMEYLRNRNDEARQCGHEETYFDLLTIIDGLKNMETVPVSALGKDTNVPTKWIPVSERLPEKEDCPMDCLVTRKSKTIGNYTDMAVAEKGGTWTHEDWEAIVLGDNVSGKKTGLLNTRGDEIVAWMPQVEPWKGEQNGQTD